MPRIMFRAFAALVLLAILLLIVPVILPRRLRRRLLTLYYRNGRPTTFGRYSNRGMAWIAAHGLTPETWPVEPRGGTISLEVRGRNSGLPRQNVVTWVEHESERYLVSMLGNHAEWVRNVRAAGGEAAILHGDRKPVLLVEVPSDQRPRVLQKYLKLTDRSTRDHLGVAPDDPVEEFERIAPDHPVFRIEQTVKAG